jgi:hypothetical protein
MLCYLCGADTNIMLAQSRVPACASCLRLEMPNAAWWTTMDTPGDVPLKVDGVVDNDGVFTVAIPDRERCVVREPSAWALQVQLEKEEHRVGELEDENRGLKARVAQLEAERYQRVSAPVAERLFRSVSPDFQQAYGYTQFDQPLQAEFEQSLQAFAQPTKAPSPAAPPPAAAEPSTPPPPTRWELLELD